MRSHQAGMYCDGLCERTDAHEHGSYDRLPGGVPRPLAHFRKGTCGVCGRSRKLAQWGKYYHRCRECYDITAEDDLRARAEQAKMLRRERAAKARLAYPCLGGPLDGEHATTDDFYRGGMFEHLANDYAEFNRSWGGGRKRIGAPATMIFVYDPNDELRLKAPRDR